MISHKSPSPRERPGSSQIYGAGHVGPRGRSGGGSARRGAARGGRGCVVRRSGSTPPTSRAGNALDGGLCSWFFGGRRWRRQETQAREGLPRSNRRQIVEQRLKINKKKHVIASAVGKASLNAREKSALERWRGELARFEEQLETLQESLGVARRVSLVIRGERGGGEASGCGEEGQACSRSSYERGRRLRAGRVCDEDERTLQEQVGHGAMPCGLTCTSCSCSSWRRVTSPPQMLAQWPPSSSGRRSPPLSTCARPAPLTHRMAWRAASNPHLRVRLRANPVLSSKESNISAHLLVQQIPFYQHPARGSNHSANTACACAMPATHYMAWRAAPEPQVHNLSVQPRANPLLSSKESNIRFIS